jgi:hypothetical protein
VVRYYGWYSNKMRGGRQPSFAKDATSKPLRPNIIPPPPRRLLSKKWRDIIMQVWHTDPIRYASLPEPHCIMPGKSSHHATEAAANEPHDAARTAIIHTLALVLLKLGALVG